MSVNGTLILLGLVFSAVAVFSWFEAGRIRTRVVTVELDGLPAALDGLRIGHLSDFHLGAPFSRGRHATERAVAWVAAQRPDLVVVTGDLLAHPRGEQRLRLLFGRLGSTIVVLGNHDVSRTRDPFSRTASLEGLPGTTVLRDETKLVEFRGQQVAVVGLDPESVHARTVDPRLLVRHAPLSVLLTHVPDVMDDLPADVFDLVLAGHIHGGQITIPWPGRHLNLAHPTARYVSGVYRVGTTVLHVSPGTGTTFVPFRLFARAEATELVLRSSRGASGQGDLRAAIQA